MARRSDTSSIPDDAAYWDALTSRVAGAMRQHQSAVVWVGSRRSGWLATAYTVAAAAIVAAALVVTTRPRGIDTGALLAAVLAPNDTLGRALVDAAAPPRVLELETRGAARASENPR